LLTGQLVLMSAMTVGRRAVNSVSVRDFPSRSTSVMSGISVPMPQSPAFNRRGSSRGEFLAGTNGGAN
jgi:hypothetical protein